MNHLEEEQHEFKNKLMKQEAKAVHQMAAIDKELERTKEKVQDLDKLSQYIVEKVNSFSKDMRMEFRETKDDIEKRIYDHVQLAIQDSRSRYDDLLRKFRAEFSDKEC